METNNRLTNFIEEYFGSIKLFSLVLSLFFLRLLFPGDISFLHDEAMLLDHALNALQQGDFIVSLGLQGTRGFKYGPYGPTFYLYLLYLTKNIYVLLFLKNLIISLMTALGVGMIMRRVKDFDRHLWLFLFLSPVLYIYARMLWDNPFLISLTALSVGSYLSYIHDKKFHFFCVALICAGLAVLTHLMVAPLCIALFLHFIRFHWKEIKEKPWHFLGIILFVAGMLLPYVRYVLANKSGVASTIQDSSYHALFFPLLGVKFYSFIDFEYFYGKQWERLFFDSELLFKLVRSTKVFWFLFYLTIPVGWFAVGKTLWQGFKQKNYQNLKFHIAYLCFVTLIIHAVLCYLSDLYKNPHYFNGVWMIHFFVLAFALSELQKLGKWGERLKLSYLVMMFLMFVGMITINKTHQGARSRRYGANLNQQVHVAKQLNQIGATDEVEYRTFHLKLFDLAMKVLRRMEPAKSMKSTEKIQTIPKVDYIHPRHKFQANGYCQLKVIAD